LIAAILRAFGRRSQAAPWNNEETIRADLFSIERLEQHAESLAAAQPVASRPTTGRSLAGRLRENEKVLLAAYRSIARAVGEGHAITPAAEWLLDNYHLVEEQVREIRDDLPPGYYRLLPKLATGPFAGYPRVFGVAWAFVAHTDSRFDPEMLRRFVRAYQRVQPLTIGELWAVAITLRIVLVENLRREATGIVNGRASREEADFVADRVLGLKGTSTESIRPILQLYERTPLPDAFAVQLVQRLRDQDPKVTRALTWLEERLAAQGTSTDEIVHVELQRQGATNVTVRNIITSMRLITDFDWAALVESRQSRRRSAAGRQRFRGHGFCDAQSLPQRDRGTRTRFDIHRAGESHRRPLGPHATASPIPHCAEGSWLPLIAGGRSCVRARDRLSLAHAQLGSPFCRPRSASAATVAAST
jgi:cyclic beta-1,2-glucan synthetase